MSPPRGGRNKSILGNKRNNFHPRRLSSLWASDPRQFLATLHAWLHTKRPDEFWWALHHNRADSEQMGNIHFVQTPEGFPDSGLGFSCGNWNVRDSLKIRMAVLKYQLHPLPEIRFPDWRGLLVDATVLGLLPSAANLLPRGVPGEKGTRTTLRGPPTAARGTIATSTSASSDIGNTSVARGPTVGSHSRSWIDCGVATTDSGPTPTFVMVVPRLQQILAHPKNRPESYRGWHLPCLSTLSWVCGSTLANRVLTP